MIALRAADLKNEFKKVSELVTSGEKVLISRPRNENLVVISEKEYNVLEKIRRNAEYLAKINRAKERFAQGHVVVKTMTELEAMAEE